MVVHGRRFEIAMLNIVIGSCDCCGVVKPFQDDICLGTTAIARDANTQQPTRLRRKHFVETFHDAYRCTCSGFCRGSQFYSKKKPKHKSIFAKHHNGIDLGDAQASGLPVTQVTICEQCHNVSRDDDLSLARPFSTRNGFGPPSPVSFSTDVAPEDPNIATKIVLAQELDTLLRSMTAAEEAAIRQVSPLVSLARLRHGNIGSKGNITCVHQDTKWNKLLPNLPTECNTVRVKYRRRRLSRDQEVDSSMASFEFERAKIQRFCEIIEIIRPPGYDDVIYDRDRLQQWPVQGNLLNHTTSVDTYDDDDDDDEAADAVVADPDQPAVDPAADACPASPTNVHDGGDAGPAPLQNPVEADEEFSAFVGQADRTSNVVADSINGQAESAMMIDALRDQCHHHSDAPAPPPVDATNTFDPTRYYQVSESNPETVITDQAAVMPTNGFVNMMRDPYAWTRAFPKLFRPTLHGDGTWHVHGDFTRYTSMRERSVKMPRWAEWMMWRRDGDPAAHPTFALVAYNEKHRAALRGQGKHVLHIAETVDDTTTIQQFMDRLEPGTAPSVPTAPHTAAPNAPNNAPNPPNPLPDVAPGTTPNVPNAPRNAAPNASASSSGLTKLKRDLNYHAGNIPGTDQYWGSILRKWQNTALFHSIVNDREATYFHSGSIAENHDPFLRRVLSQYVSKVQSPEQGQRILEDDQAFFLATSKYKQVVTHYFCCKSETWFATVLGPVLGVVDYMKTNEFAKSRGAIHFHSVIYSDSPQDTKLNEALHGMAMRLHGVLQDLEGFLLGPALEKEGNPGSIYNGDLPPKVAKDAAEEWLSKGDDECKAAYDAYQASLRDAYSAATDSISAVLMGELGYSALHSGECPQDWIEPMGRKALGYTGDSTGMAKKRDVMDQAELKQFKFAREDNLFQRKVNMTNHCWCHRCSDYCLRDELIVTPYNAALHKDEAKFKPFMQRQRDGTQVRMVRTCCRKCRMGFNYQLEFPRGSDGDRTGGIAPNYTPHIEFDGNGVAKLVPLRNYHRTVEEPLIAFSFAANCDFRRFLHDATPIDQDCFFDNNPEHVLDTLHALGVEGICRASGAETCQIYACGYACKGSKASQEWTKCFNRVATAYLQENLQKDMAANAPPGTHTTSLSQVVASFMREISKGRDVPKDEASFLLAGGELHQNSSDVKHASISSVKLADVMQILVSHVPIAILRACDVAKLRTREVAKLRSCDVAKLRN